METLTANLAGNIRRELSRGREYIVAPVTLIVPGVLTGSQGPLYYPPGEVEASVGIWNNKPITLDHPRSNGRPVSAGHKNGVVKLGLIKNSMFANGRLKAEAWLDVVLVNRVEPDLLATVQRGDPVEVSTGLYTDNKELDNEKECNGKKYKKVARNYRADHLAVLLHQQGACSIADGCGLNQNHAQGKHDQKDHGNWARGQGSLPSATSVGDIEDAKRRAVAGGFSGFFVDEGKREPPSVFFVKKVFASRKRVRKLLQKRSGSGKTIKLYRGVSSGSPSSGHYYTTVRDWARQFTRTGRDEEIRTIEVYLSDIMDDSVNNSLPVLHHTPGGHDHDQSKHGDRGGTATAEKGSDKATVKSVKWKEQLLKRIKAEGGMTLDAVTGEEPEEGFAVSPYPDRCVLFDTKDITEVDVVNFLIDNDSLLTKEDHYFGPWREVDKNKGIDRIFLDVSVVLEDQSDATKLALSKDQKGIFNLKTKEYIEVDKDATWGGAINQRGESYGKAKDGARRKKEGYFNLRGSHAGFSKANRQKAHTRRNQRSQRGLGQATSRKVKTLNKRNGTFTLSNKEASMPLNAEERRKVVDNLVESCCWEEDDRKVLNALSDEQLTRLQLKLEEDEEMMAVVNAAVDTLEIDPDLEINDLPEAIKNAKKSFIDKHVKKAMKKRLKEDGKTKDEDEDVGEPPTDNDEGDWMKKIPKEAREDIEFARNQRKKRKEEIVEMLLANASDTDKKTHRERLMSRSIEDLEADLALLPEQPTGNRGADYTGATGGMPISNRGGKKPTPLAEPVHNFDDLSPLSRKD